jgi:undecaprenyl-diphosphatase
MDFWYALLKGALQGLTEFLPVSSSAHLVLFDVFSQMFGWVSHRQSPVVEEFFDILLHLGTLSAVLVYFRQEVFAILKALPLLFSTPKSSEASVPIVTMQDGSTWHAASLVRGLALSFIVTAVVSVGGIKGSEIIFAKLGLATANMGDISAFYRLHPEWVAVNLLITGLLLWFSEWRSDVQHKQQLEAEHFGETQVMAVAKPMSMTFKQAATIGFFQACAAIFRGISRSGSTMASSLLVGLTRQQAARYSFLLSIPIFISAAVYEFLKLLKAGVSFDGLPWLVMLSGVISSAVVGYLCIAWFIKLISKVSLTMFSIYCWIAGTVLLIILPKMAG